MEEPEPRCERCGKPASVFTQECRAVANHGVTASTSHQFCKQCAAERKFTGNARELEERFARALEPIPIAQFAVCPLLQHPQNDMPLRVVLVVADEHMRSPGILERASALLAELGVDGALMGATEYQTACDSLATRLRRVDGVDESAVTQVIELGFTDFLDLAEVSPDDLANASGLDLGLASTIVARARRELDRRLKDMR